MKILVTGGAGYIGSVVVSELVNAGHEVTVLDNLFKGHRDAVHPEARFVWGDIRDLRKVVLALDASQAEVVIHMAAHSEARLSVTKPAPYFDNNVNGGLVLLEAMRVHGVKGIIFSSTAAIYEAFQGSPITEESRISPTNPYGHTKLAFEYALQAYGEAYGMRHASLRFFNAAGAWQGRGERHDPETHLIPAALAVAAERLPVLQIFGDNYQTRDGTCVRDYVHVVDIAQAHIKLLDAIVSGRLKHNAYNVGCGGDGYSVREVVSSVERVTGRRVPVELHSPRLGDASALVASSTLLTRETGWIPTFRKLDEIVESAWEVARR